MDVCCECCMLSVRGLCSELITRPEESYRLWCVVVCDLEISRMRRPWPALGRSVTAKKKKRWEVNFSCTFAMSFCIMCGFFRLQLRAVIRPYVVTGRNSACIQHDTKWMCLANVWLLIPDLHLCKTNFRKCDVTIRCDALFTTVWLFSNLSH